MSRSSHFMKQIQLQQQQQQQLQQQQMAENDAAALAAEMFDHFCIATTMRQVLGLYRNMCDAVGLRPSPLNEFYPKLKAKIKNWKAAALWKKFDARAAHRVYNKGNACTGTRVLVIGAGPCGLRTAIEAQLLGAKVVVIEKRDRISRNNVLHLWPFVITDLRNLGAKKFYGKFCAGSIDHISIRQLQCILLKVALLLGVEIHEGVSFENIIEPTDGCGWRAQVSPEDHAVSHYEFDVLIGADGKRNTLEGFKRKEFRGKLAIAITANFINKKTEAEAKVEEISGVAFIFNQSFFKELYQTTGIDLENIVYYKDETHYFVMTAKKHSLIDKGVIIQDFADPAELLSPANVNTDKLLDYAREAAEFSTKYQMTNLEFAVNHYGKPDVAMFDFTSMFAAESSCRVTVRKNYRLLQCLVGDSLLEPFWPTGSGCARGFLSSMDAAYAVKLWSNTKNSILGVLAQRESIYRLLAQTTPENLQRDIGAYTLDPASRYPNLNRSTVNVWQVKNLLDTDDKALLEQTHMDTSITQGVICETPVRRKRRSGDTLPLSAILLRWIKAQLHAYEFTQHLNEVSDVFTNGKVLVALINRYRPDLVDLNVVKDWSPKDCNELAFKILENEMGIHRVMSSKESITLEGIDSKIWLNYLEQICEVFRGEIPHVKHPKLDLSEFQTKSATNRAPDFSNLLQMANRKGKSPLQDIDMTTNVTHRRSVLDEDRLRKQRKFAAEYNPPAIDTSRRAKKRRSHEKSGNIEERQQRLQEIEANRQERQNRRKLLRYQQTQNFYKSLQMLHANTLLRQSDSSSPFEDYSIYLYRQQAPEFNDRVKELERKLLHPDRERGIPSALPRGTDEQFTDRIKSMEQRITSRNNYGAEKKPKDLLRAIGKLESNDWNVREIEKKIEQSKKTEAIGKSREKVPKWSKEQFLARQHKMSKPIDRQESVDEKYKEIDKTIKNLDKQLRGGLEVGERGKNKVASIAGQFVKKDDTSEEKSAPIPKSTSKVGLVFNKQSKTEKCHFCKQTVYLMERISAENLILHRSCLKCHHCHTNLRLGGYAFDRDDPVGKFYCTQHYRLPAKEIRPVVRRSRNQRKNDSTQNQNPSDKNLQTPVRGRPGDVAQLDLLDRGQTPERIEFENIDAMSDGEPSLENVIDENEWTDRNFITGDEDTESDLSNSDSSDDDTDSDMFEEANGSPIGAQTLQLANEWIGKQKYSNVIDSEEEDDFYDSSEGLLEDDADSQTEGEEFKKAREMRRQEVKLQPPPAYLPTDTETEVKTDDDTHIQTFDTENNTDKMNKQTDNKITTTDQNTNNTDHKNELKNNNIKDSSNDTIRNHNHSEASKNDELDSNDLGKLGKNIDSSNVVEGPLKIEIKTIERNLGRQVSNEIDALNENLYNLNNLIKMQKDVENLQKENLVKSDIMKKLLLKEKWLKEEPPINDNGMVKENNNSVTNLQDSNNKLKNDKNEVEKNIEIDKIVENVEKMDIAHKNDISNVENKNENKDDKKIEDVKNDVKVEMKQKEIKENNDKKSESKEINTPTVIKRSKSKISETENVKNENKLTELEIKRLSITGKSLDKDIGKLLYDAEHKFSPKSDKKLDDALKKIEVKNFSNTMDTIKSHMTTPKVSKQSSLDLSKYFPNQKQEKVAPVAKNKNQKNLKDVDLTKYFPQSPVNQRKTGMTLSRSATQSPAMNRKSTQQPQLDKNSISEKLSRPIINTKNSVREKSPDTLSQKSKSNSKPNILNQPKPNILNRSIPNKNKLDGEKSKTGAQVNNISKAPPKKQDSKEFDIFDQLLDGAVDIKNSPNMTKKVVTAKKPLQKKTNQSTSPKSKKKAETNKEPLKDDNTKKEKSANKILNEDERKFEEIMDYDIENERSPSKEYRNLFHDEKSPSTDVSDKIDKLFINEKADIGTSKRRRGSSLDEEELQKLEEELQILNSILDASEEFRRETSTESESEESEDSTLIREENDDFLMFRKTENDKRNSMSDLEKTMEYLRSEWRSEATNFLLRKRESFYAKERSKSREKESNKKEIRIQDGSKIKINLNSAKADVQKKDKNEKSDLLVKKPEPENKVLEIEVEVDDDEIDSFLDKIMEEMKDEGGTKKDTKSDLDKKVEEIFSNNDQEKSTIPEVSGTSNAVEIEQQKEDNVTKKNVETNLLLSNPFVDIKTNPPILSLPTQSKDSQTNDALINETPVKDFKPKTDISVEHLSVPKRRKSTSVDSIEELFKGLSDDMLVDIEFDSEGELIAITPRGTAEIETENKSDESRKSDSKSPHDENRNKRSSITENCKSSPKMLKVSDLNSKNEKSKSTSRSSSITNGKEGRNFDGKQAFGAEEDFEFVDIDRDENFECNNSQSAPREHSNKNTNSVSKELENKNEKLSSLESSKSEKNPEELNQNENKNETAVVHADDTKIGSVEKFESSPEKSSFLTSNKNDVEMCIKNGNSCKDKRNEKSSSHTEKENSLEEKKKTHVNKELSQPIVPITETKVNELNSGQFPKKPLRRQKSVSSSMSPEFQMTPSSSRKQSLVKLNLADIPPSVQDILKNIGNEDQVYFVSLNDETPTKFPTKYEDDDLFVNENQMETKKSMTPDIKVEQKTSNENSPENSLMTEEEYIEQLERERRRSLIKRDEMYAKQNTTNPLLLVENKPKLMVKHSQIQSKALKRDLRQLSKSESELNSPKPSPPKVPPRSPKPARRLSRDRQQNSTENTPQSDILPRDMNSKSPTESLSKSTESIPNRPQRTKINSTKKPDSGTDILLERSKMLHDLKEDFMNDKMIGNNPYLKRTHHTHRNNENDDDNDESVQDGIRYSTTREQRNRTLHFPTSRAIEDRRYDRRKSKSPEYTSFNRKFINLPSTMATRNFVDYFKRSPSQPKESRSNEQTKDSCVQTDTESSSPSNVELNSATEISTDSEFDHDPIVRETPRIFIDDTHIKKPTKVQVKQGIVTSSPTHKLANNNNNNSNNKNQSILIKEPPQLEFKPLVQVDPSLLNSNRLPLKNPRAGDYLLNKTPSTEGIASKKSLELKKRYLLGEQGIGNGIMKSGSTSILDSKLKNFNSYISECQKLLNPGANISPSMKTFLDKTKIGDSNKMISGNNSTSTFMTKNSVNESEKKDSEKENMFVNSRNELNKSATTAAILTTLNSTIGSGSSSGGCGGGGGGGVNGNSGNSAEYSETVNTALVENISKTVNQKITSPVLETIDLISPEKSVPLIDLTKINIPSEMIKSNQNFIKNIEMENNQIIKAEKIIDLTEDTPTKDKSNKKDLEKICDEKPDVSKDVKDVIPDIITHIGDVKNEKRSQELSEKNSYSHNNEEKENNQQKDNDIQETCIEVPNIPWNNKTKNESDMESDSLSSSTTSSLEDIPHYILDSTTSPDTQNLGIEQIVPRLEVHDSSGALMQIDSLMIIDGKYVGDPEDLKLMEIPEGTKIEFPISKDTQKKEEDDKEMKDEKQKNVDEKEKEEIEKETDEKLSSSDKESTPTNKPKSIPQFDHVTQTKKIDEIVNDKIVIVSTKPNLKFDSKNENKIDTLKNLPLVIEKDDKMKVIKPTTLDLGKSKVLSTHLNDKDRTPTAERGVSDSETEVTGQALTETELSDWTADDAVSENFVDIEFALNSNKGTIKRNKRAKKKSPSPSSKGKMSSSFSSVQQQQQQQQHQQQQQQRKQREKVQTPQTPQTPTKDCGIFRNLDIDEIEFMDTGSEGSYAETYSATNRAMLMNRGYIEFIENNANNMSQDNYRSEKNLHMRSDLKDSLLAPGKEVRGVDYIEQGACILSNDYDLKTPVNEILPAFSNKQQSEQQISSSVQQQQQYQQKSQPQQSSLDVANDIDEDSLQYLTSQGTTDFYTTTTEESEALTVVTSPLESAPKTSLPDNTTTTTSPTSSSDKNDKTTSSTTASSKIPIKKSSSSDKERRSEERSKQSSREDLLGINNNKNKDVDEMSYEEYVRKLQMKITQISNARDSIDVRKQKRKSSKSEVGTGSIGAIEGTQNNNSVIENKNLSIFEPDKSMMMVTAMPSMIASGSSSSLQQQIQNQKVPEVPTLSRKLEEITKERTKQKDLIHDLVMDKLQSKKQLNAEKRLNRSRNRSLFSSSGISSPPSKVAVSSNDCSNSPHYHMPSSSSERRNSKEILEIQQQQQQKENVCSKTKFSPKDSKQIAQMFANSPRLKQRPLSDNLETVTNLVFDQTPKITKTQSFCIYTPRNSSIVNGDQTKYQQFTIDNTAFATPLPPPRTNRKYDETLSASREKLRAEARARARLKSNEELGLSPEEKLQILRKRYHLDMHEITSSTAATTPTPTPTPTTSISPSNLVSVMESSNKSDDNKLRERKMVTSKSVNDITAVQANLNSDENLNGKSSRELIDFTSDPNLSSQQEKTIKCHRRKDPERRKSLIQTVSSFFNKKKEKDSLSPQSPTKEKSSDSVFSRFRISPKSKEKSKDKDLITSGDIPIATASAITSNTSTSVTTKEATYSSSPQLFKRSDDVSPPPIPPLPTNYQRSDDESYTTESREQKKQRAISKASRQAELKRLRIAQEIQREQEEIEVKLKELEAKGVLIEKTLRGEDENIENLDSSTIGASDEKLFKELLGIWRNITQLKKRDEELAIQQQELQLEHRHAQLREELDMRLSFSKLDKSSADVAAEGAILNEMLEIVAKRAALRPTETVASTSGSVSQQSEQHQQHQQHQQQSNENDDSDVSI